MKDAFVQSYLNISTEEKTTVREIFDFYSLIDLSFLCGKINIRNFIVSFHHNFIHFLTIFIAYITS